MKNTGAKCCHPWYIHRMPRCLSLSRESAKELIDQKKNGGHQASKRVIFMWSIEASTNFLCWNICPIICLKYLCFTCLLCASTKKLCIFVCLLCWKKKQKTAQVWWTCMCREVVHKQCQWTFSKGHSWVFLLVLWFSQLTFFFQIAFHLLGSIKPTFFSFAASLKLNWIIEICV